MAAVKWYRTGINVGAWHRDVFFYETDKGQFDLQYHWMYTTRMHDRLQDAVTDFAEGFVHHHNLTGDKQLTISTPNEVAWDDVQAARPSNQPSPYFDGP